ncbi:MAG: hypothetical protein IPM16_16355 [Chloroflexi bacterium]|nr:hypothetical protein [Chloroflexota bacterium]
MHRLNLIVILLSVLYTLEPNANFAQSARVIATTAAAWSHSGELIAFVGADFYERDRIPEGYITIYDPLRKATVLALTVEYGGYTSVAWSPDDTRIAVSGYDQTVRVFDAAHGTLVATLPEHRAIVTSVDWSPDGNYIVSAAPMDPRVILWDARTYEVTMTLNVSDPWAVAFSPDGASLAIGGIGGLMLIPMNDLAGVSDVSNLSQYRVADGYLGAVAWSADSSKIAFGNHTFRSLSDPEGRTDAYLWVFDVSSGEEILSAVTGLWGIYGNAIRGGVVATHSIDGTVQVWSLKSDKLVRIAAHSGTAEFSAKLDLSNYGARLAYGRSYVADVNQTQETRQEGELAFDVVVPDPSLERLNGIAEACVPESAARDPFVADSLAEVGAFVERLDALPDDAIPPACRADLLAVAEALMAGAGQ